MPIYEYECRQCGHRFEYLALPSSPAAECPACRKTDLEQLISLCGMSSETTRQANLSAAHKKAGAAYKDKQHSEHKRLHDHFD
jgi:putative FmdB family regulatory protein